MKTWRAEYITNDNRRRVKYVETYDISDKTNATWQLYSDEIDPYGPGGIKNIISIYECDCPPEMYRDYNPPDDKSY